MAWLTTILMFAPFILILWLANLADRRRAPGEQHSFLALLAHGLLILLYGGIILVGLLFFLLGKLKGELPPGMVDALMRMGIETTGAKTALSGIGLGLWLPPLVAIILLLRPVRHLLARLLPLDPARTVHAVALSYTMLIFSNLLLTLGWGLHSMVTVMEAAGAETTGSLIVTAWVQEVLWAFMGLLGVGWLSRRGLGQVLSRLGLVVPRLGQVAIGLAAGLALVPAVLAVEALAGLVGIAPDADVARLTEALIGPLFRTLPGILTLGVAAGLGEETIFRGALQPRFGLVPTAALFALLHSNYGLSLSTLIVFMLGLVLGLLRQRANATTAMVTHAVYNSALGMIAFLSLR